MGSWNHVVCYSIMIRSIAYIPLGSLLNILILTLITNGTLVLMLHMSTNISRNCRMETLNSSSFCRKLLGTDVPIVIEPRLTTSILYGDHIFTVSTVLCKVVSMDFCKVWIIFSRSSSKMPWVFIVHSKQRFGQSEIKKKCFVSFIQRLFVSLIVNELMKF